MTVAGSKWVGGFMEEHEDLVTAAVPKGNAHAC